MKPKSVIVSIFMVLLLFSLAYGESGQIDLPKEATLIIKLDGKFKIKATAGLGKLEYSVAGIDRKGEKIDGLFLVAKQTKEGYLLIVKHKPGTPGYDRLPEINLNLDSKYNLHFSKVKGHYIISNMAGTISGKINGGRLVLDKCSGEVNLEAKDGKIKVIDHRAKIEPFFLKMKQGNLFIEVGNSKTIGPGEVMMKSGRVTWKLTRPAKLDFFGEVKEGVIICNLPISRMAKDVILFRSLGGGTTWNINVEKGMLKVELPSR